MQPDSHERAQLLLDRAAVEGISPQEQRWVDSHIAECAECSRYAELSRRAIGALDHFAFDLDPAAALRVQEAVRRRAGQLAPAGAFGPGVWIANLAAIALTIAGSIGMWQAMAWLAGRWGLASSAWQIGIAVFWLLPSVVLDALLLCRPVFLKMQSEREGQTT